MNICIVYRCSSAAITFIRVSSRGIRVTRMDESLVRARGASITFRSGSAHDSTYGKNADIIINTIVYVACE